MRTEKLMLTYPVRKNPFARPIEGTDSYGVTTTVDMCIMRVEDFDREQCEAALAMPITSKRLLKAIHTRIAQLPTPDVPASEPDGESK